MTRERGLQIVLVLVGLLFTAGIYSHDFVAPRDPPGQLPHLAPNSLAHCSGGVGGWEAGSRLARTWSREPMPIREAMRPGVDRENWMALAASPFRPSPWRTKSGKLRMSCPW